MTKEFRIVVFAGDNCGPEVMKEAIKVSKPNPKVIIEHNLTKYKVLDVFKALQPPINFHYDYQLLGGASIDAYGVPLTQEAVEAAKAADAVLLGAIGGPKWGTGVVRPEQGLLGLRKAMNAYGNLRPCKFAAQSLIDLSPLKRHIVEGTDLVILRELVGGMYFGPSRRDPDEELSWAQDVDLYSRSEIERVARLAGALAMQHDPPLPVWSLDKANVLAATGRLWRLVVSKVFEKEYPRVPLGHHLIDSAAMLLMKKPTALNGIVLTSNVFGDIISDEASVIPGSLGLLPSASLCEIPAQGKCVKGIYEPIHGSAPDIVGQGIVNPAGMILSAALMLRHSLGLETHAKAVELAVAATIDSGLRTTDIGGTARTSDFGDAVVKNLIRGLKMGDL